VSKWSWSWSQEPGAERERGSEKGESGKRESGQGWGILVCGSSSWVLAGAVRFAPLALTHFITKRHNKDQKQPENQQEVV